MGTCLTTGTRRTRPHRAPSGGGLSYVRGKHSVFWATRPTRGINVKTTPQIDMHLANTEALFDRPQRDGKTTVVVSTARVPETLSIIPISAGFIRRVSWRYGFMKGRSGLRFVQVHPAIEGYNSIAQELYQSHRPISHEESTRKGCSGLWCWKEAGESGFSEGCLVHIRRNRWSGSFRTI